MEKILRLRIEFSPCPDLILSCAVPGKPASKYRILALSSFTISWNWQWPLVLSSAVLVIVSLVIELWHEMPILEEFHRSRQQCWNLIHFQSSTGNLLPLLLSSGRPVNIFVAEGLDCINASTTSPVTIMALRSPLYDTLASIDATFFPQERKK